ncbi:MAG: tRNA lysidine(34) synthetase TilS [Chloroflexota bacterium]|nr:tRNA lysidine(34) synthetase TilS [Chloroflexota bacterium]
MAVIDQVRTTIVEHRLFSHGDKVVVGVSGGPDSLTLLHVLRALRQELGIDLFVAHLNHQLRGSDSDADAQFVAWLAQEWTLPATIEARDVRALADAEHLSLEEAARHARYALLIDVAKRVGANVIAVAHHADDQAETVLMHLLRGAGLAGLRGMRYKIPIQELGFSVPTSSLQLPTSGLQLVRPLLDITRAEIAAYCKQNDLTPRQDNSNFDTAFFRNRLRHETLPYLETLNPNLHQVLARTARAVTDDYDFVNRGMRLAYSLIAREEKDGIVFDRAAWRTLHPALQRGTLRAAVQQLRGDLRDIDWTPIEDARRVALDKAAGAAATLPTGLMLSVGYTDFTIADAARGVPMPDLPLLHVERVGLPVEGVTPLPDSDWVVQTEKTHRAVETADRWTARLDLEKCQGEAYLRRRRAGDRFQPAGLGGHTQTLHEFMINEKIQRAARALLPLLVVNDQIAWVCGWRVDERARATDTTREFWQVTFRKKEKR